MSTVTNKILDEWYVETGKSKMFKDTSGGC